MGVFYIDGGFVILIIRESSNSWELCKQAFFFFFTIF